jgi:hypothetical protein
MKVGAGILQKRETLVQIHHLFDFASKEEPCDAKRSQRQRRNATPYRLGGGGRHFSGGDVLILIYCC